MSATDGSVDLVRTKAGIIAVWKRQREYSIDKKTWQVALGFPVTLYPHSSSMLFGLWCSSRRGQTRRGAFPVQGPYNHSSLLVSGMVQHQQTRHIQEMPPQSVVRVTHATGTCPMKTPESTIVTTCTFVSVSSYCLDVAMSSICRPPHPIRTPCA
jgi:hypothetical protein